jgi:hypothetical protein
VPRSRAPTIAPAKSEIPVGGEIAGERDESYLAGHTDMSITNGTSILSKKPREML